MKSFLERIFVLRKAPQEDWSRGKLAVYWGWQLLMLLGAGTAFGMVLLRLSMGPYDPRVFWEYLADVPTVLLNTLPVLLLTFLFYGICGRAWAGFCIGGGLSLVLSLINYFKLFFRNDPFIFEDVLLVKEASKMTSGGHYELFVNKAILIVAGCYIAAVLLLALLARGRLGGWKKRCSVLLGTVLAFCVFIPSVRSQKVYSQMENYQRLNRWNPTENYVSHGFLYPFIHSTWDFFQTPPENYSDERAEELLASYTGEDMPEEKKVSIIALMREAYADFSQYDIEGFDNSCYDLYHEIEAESYCGNLLTNIFGGGTIDSERCFLTGNFQLKNFRSNANSYLWYLRDQGYTVEGIHPYYQWFYNRQNVNSYIGFQNYRYKEGDFDQMTDVDMPPDSLMLPEVLKDFQKGDKPYFSFNLNVQSHGPYNEKSYGGERQYLTGDYSDGCKNAMNNYTNSIMETDVELAKLLDQLRDDPEPVIFITFGDHLPWMGDGGCYYDEMGVDIDPSTEDGFRRHYTTRYVIWANNAAKEALGFDFVGQGPTISPCYLMGLVFDLMGCKGPAFMQAMNDMMETMPVVTTHDAYVIDGQFTAAVPPEREQLMEDFRIMQHYWRNNFLYE